MKLLRTFTCGLTGDKCGIYLTPEGTEVCLSRDLVRIGSKDPERDLEVYEDEQEIESLCIEYLLF